VRDGEITAEWAAFWREVREDPKRTARILALETEPRNAGEADRAVSLGLEQKKYAEAAACARAIAGRFPLVRYNGACAAALAGDRKLAIRWLREDLAANPTKKHLEWMLEDPDLESLRTDEYKAFWAEVRQALEKAK
jgi:hypothetical protein